MIARFSLTGEVLSGNFQPNIPKSKVPSRKTLSDAPLNQPARVSVVSTLRDRIHHEDAENTEGAQQNLAIGHYLAERNLVGQLAPNPLQIHCQIPELRDINPHIPRAVLQLELTLPGF